MALDQSKLGQHVQQQMAAIEEDENVPDDAEIGAILTIVELTSPAEKSGGGGNRNFRVRSNVPPHAAIGLLEEAKMVQLSQLRQQGR